MLDSDLITKELSLLNLKESVSIFFFLMFKSRYNLSE